MYFPRTGNSAQLRQNFGIWGGRGVEPSNPPRYATDTSLVTDIGGNRSPEDVSGILVRSFVCLHCYTFFPPKAQL
jgi:hypothetical protein